MKSKPTILTATALAVGSSDLLESLAARMDHRAVDINGAHARTGEDKAVRRSMVVIYSELAEMLREESRKATARITMSTEKQTGDPIAERQAVGSSDLLACAVALVEIVEGVSAPLAPWRSIRYRCGGRLKDHEAWCRFYVAVKQAQANVELSDRRENNP